jgi:hypothetical protein
MKISGYTPGSIYKRFNGTTMSQMNRAAVASASSALSSYGDSVFSTNLAQSQGISELVAKQYAARITAEAKEKLQSATNIQSILSSLGATSSS